MREFEFRIEGMVPEQLRRSRHPRPRTQLGTGVLLGAGIVMALAYVGGPSLRVESRLDFGFEQVGAAGEKELKLSNTGSSPLRIAEVVLADPQSSFTKVADRCSQMSLEPGQDCAVSVRFLPRAPAGATAATLRIADDARDSPQEVLLLGTGTPRPDLDIEPNPLGFSDQEIFTSSEWRSVTVRNDSKSPLRITHVGLANADSASGAGDFSVSQDCTAGPLKPQGGKCPVRVRFIPGVEAERRATLVIADDTGDALHNVAVSGKGIRAKIGLNRENLSFKTTEVGQSSQTEYVTVTSQGSAPLRLRQMGAAGANPGDFRVSDDGCGGATLPPGQSCRLGVAFAPTAPGVRSATVTIPDNAEGSPQAIVLSGAATPPPAPRLEIVPRELDFGVQEAGRKTQPQTISLTNRGRAPLRIDSIKVEGTGRASFRADNNCVGNSLPPGGSCEVRVSFGGAAVFSLGLAVPPKPSAGLIITDNAQDSPQTVPLTGTSLPRRAPAPPPSNLPAPPAQPSIASFQVNPPGLSFKASQYQTDKGSVSVRNDGSRPVRITARIGNEGGARFFRIGGMDCAVPLAPGSACTIQLYATGLAGTATGTLYVQDSQSGLTRRVSLRVAGGPG